MCLQLFIIRRLGSGTVIYIIKHHPVFCNADKPDSDPKAGNIACFPDGRGNTKSMKMSVSYFVRKMRY